METKFEKKLTLYYITAILSLLFAAVGFSYNAWRLEATEDNSNIRTAAFEVLNTLAEFEQIIYAAHYDKDMVEGSPRKGWIKLGLIVDLSVLISKSVEEASLKLKNSWSDNWEKIPDSQTATTQIAADIDQVRKEIQRVLRELR